ncbi:DNA-binding protein [Bacteroidia bacterium]|nr:DNA-binding protein [Bacteroidia bacterium]GHU66893.1 DNA-binding protein [Bacteroidia bacterium]
MNELEIIQTKVFEIRTQRVMLDFHLAEMYGIETRVLKQAVRRNMERFPPDFMFTLEQIEFAEVITNCDKLRMEVKFTPSMPFCFTEQGIAMLSSVLRSPQAIEINIAIMRAFVELRKYALGYAELKQRLDHLELDMNLQIRDIYTVLSEMEEEKAKKARPVVGYIQPKN